MQNNAVCTVWQGRPYTHQLVSPKGRLEGDRANGGGVLGHGTLSLENGGEVVHAALVEGSKIWEEC